MSIHNITLHHQEIPRTDHTEEQPVDKPETETPRSKACSFTKETSKGTKTGRVLYAHHDRLRDSLNFQAIHPYLSRARLIPVKKQKDFIQNVRDEAKEECLTQLLALSKNIDNPNMLESYLDAFQKLTSLNDPLTRHDQVDRLLSVLSCSRDAKCMEKFIQCLKDSSTESYAGESHLHLAEELEKAWDEEPDISVTLEISDAHYPPKRLTFKAKYNAGIGKIQTMFLLLCSLKFLCCFGIPLVLILLGIIATATVSQVPTVHSPSSTSDSVVAHGSDIAEINLQAGDLKLVSNIEVVLGQHSTGLGTCNGTVHVIRGIECSNLNTTSRRRSSTDGSVRFTPQLLYLLPGSEINISFDPRNVISDFVSIVIGIEAYRKCTSNPGDCSCDALQSFPTDLYHCFNVSEFLAMGGPIVFQVNATDYYSVIDRDETYRGMIYTVLEVQYDLRPNVVNEELLTSRFETAALKHVSIVLNENWQFDPPSCILYQSNCSSDLNDDHANLTVTSVQRRKDIVLFPGLFLILSVLLFCIFTVIACVLQNRKTRSAKID